MRSAVTPIMLIAFVLLGCDGLKEKTVQQSLQHVVSACQLEGIRLYKPTFPTTDNNSKYYEVSAYTRICVRKHGYVFKESLPGCAGNESIRLWEHAEASCYQLEQR